MDRARRSRAGSTAEGLRLDLQRSRKRHHGSACGLQACAGRGEDDALRSHGGSGFARRTLMPPRTEACASASGASTADLDIDDRSGLGAYQEIPVIGGHPMIAARRLAQLVAAIIGHRILPVAEKLPRQAFALVPMTLRLAV